MKLSLNELLSFGKIKLSKSLVSPKEFETEGFDLEGWLDTMPSAEETEIESQETLVS